MIRMQQNEEKDCKEIILSESAGDFFVRLDGGVELAKERFEPDCIQVVDSKYAVLYYELSEMEQRRFQGERYRYPEFPRCFGLQDRSNMEAAGINQLHRQPYLDLLGQGVLIGFIDTGDCVFLMSRK